MLGKGHDGMYKAPEESERLRGEGDKIKFIDLRFERGKLQGLGKEEKGSINCMFLGGMMICGIVTLFVM